MRRNFKPRDTLLQEADSKCELCDSENNLQVHHKDFDSSNNASSNAQVLCLTCHIHIHKKVAETATAKHMAEIQRNDLEIEAHGRQIWVNGGGSLDEIGGQEFNKFFHNWVVNK